MTEFFDKIKGLLDGGYEVDPVAVAVAGVLFVLALLSSVCAVIYHRRSAERRARDSLSAGDADFTFDGEEGRVVCIFRQDRQIAADEATTTNIRFACFPGQIIGFVHSHPVSRRQAANSRNADPKLLSVAHNISWTVSEIIANDNSTKGRQQIIPLGAAVWVVANALFGENNNRQIILSITAGTHAVTYSIGIKDGEPHEQIIYGESPETTMEIVGDNVVHINLMSDNAETAVYTPPQAAETAAVTVKQFRRIACEIKPILPFKDENHFALPIVGLAVFCGLSAAVAVAAQSWMTQQIQGIENEIESEKEKEEALREKIREHWRAALLSFVDEKRVNLAMYFQIADHIAIISPVKNFEWKRKDGVSFTAEVEVRTGAGNIAVVRENLEYMLGEVCKIEEKWEVGGKNEVNFYISCAG